MKIFVDSGAFSAWTQGREIDLDKYIEFCNTYKDDVEVIASLDVIPGAPNKRLTGKMVEDAAKQGYNNYLKMIKCGVPHDKLLHTFHQGDPEKWLEKLVVNEGAYIGISPANDRTTTQRKEWLTKTCMPIILNSKGKPKVKFHGFAVTSLKLVFDYPWYSVDSNSWRLRGGGFGMIDLPCNMRMEKESDFNITSLPISNGVKNYTDKEVCDGLFNLQRVSQREVSFRKMPHTYRKKAVELLEKYEFDIKELEDDHMGRTVWNAIYLMTTIERFRNTVLFLASTDLRTIRCLKKKIRQLNLKTSNFNILFSYGLRPSPSFINRLLKIKKNA